MAQPVATSDGAMMDRFRYGTLTDVDYNLLVAHAIGSPNGSTLENVPIGTQIACFENENRVALNNAVFAHQLCATTHSMTTDRHTSTQPHIRDHRQQHYLGTQ
jgi:hypothetical protein